MGEELKVGSKVSVEMGEIETLHCEVTAEKDEDVLCSFWVPKSQFESA